MGPHPGYHCDDSNISVSVTFFSHTTNVFNFTRCNAASETVTLKHYPRKFISCGSSQYQLESFQCSEKEDQRGTTSYLYKAYVPLPRCLSNVRKCTRLVNRRLDDVELQNSELIKLGDRCNSVLPHHSQFTLIDSFGRTRILRFLTVTLWDIFFFSRNGFTHDHHLACACFDI